MPERNTAEPTRADQQRRCSFRAFNSARFFPPYSFLPASSRQRSNHTKRSKPIARNAGVLGDDDSDVKKRFDGNCAMLRRRIQAVRTCLQCIPNKSRMRFFDTEYRLN